MELGYLPKLINYTVKKIKKNLKLNILNNTDPTFSDTRFVDKYGRSTCFLKSTHTVYNISQKKNRLNYTNIRDVWKRFWYPTKLKYRYVGKSYRVRIKPDVMFLRFNKAHLTTLIHTGNKLDYFKNKGFWLRMWKTKQEVIRVKHIFRVLRPRNVFTSRGIWSRNKLYLKKRGKVSGYR